MYTEFMKEKIKIEINEIDYFDKSCMEYLIRCNNPCFLLSKKFPQDTNIYFSMGIEDFQNEQNYIQINSIELPELSKLFDFVNEIRQKNGEETAGDFAKRIKQQFPNCAEYRWPVDEIKDKYYLVELINSVS